MSDDAAIVCPRTYEAALVCAKAEFDAMTPDVLEMNTRYMWLRRSINSISGLLEKPVEERYEFHRQPRPPDDPKVTVRRQR